MIKIKVTYPGIGRAFDRQMPGRSLIWNNCEFSVNQENEVCDFWFIVGGLNSVDTVKCPNDNMVFLTREPESVKFYPESFLNQFGKIATFRQDILNLNKRDTFQWTVWFVGRRVVDGKIASLSKDYDELKTINDVKKEKLISVITSAKQLTEGHRERYNFVMKLKEYFGDRLDVYGNGVNGFEDKWDVIAPYKYHIALENSSSKNYWTEKLADCFLAGAYPLYYGCPNIHDYFPEDSLSVIDIHDFDAAVKTIENVITSMTYEKSISAISKAKNQILDEYNIAAMMASYANENYSQGDKKSIVTLYPQAQKQRFKRLDSLFRMLKHVLYSFNKTSKQDI